MNEPEGDEREEPAICIATPTTCTGLTGSEANSNFAIVHDGAAGASFTYACIQAAPDVCACAQAQRVLRVDHVECWRNLQKFRRPSAQLDAYRGLDLR